MLTVALTGNVAAGKSTVLAHFVGWGAGAVDSDQLAREAVAPGSPTLAAIAARFGADLVRLDGTLDRGMLRRRVMGDDERRAALNAIVHPEVQRLHAERIEAARKSGVAILISDIPLLFEVLDPDAWDMVVLVDAPEETRRRRLMELRGLSREEADDLIEAQLPSHQKRARSHIVIDNDGSLDALAERARKAWAALEAEAARRGAQRNRGGTRHGTLFA
jgi:dephospho-CoA kinase